MHHRFSLFAALIVVALAGAAVALGAFGSNGRQRVVTTAKNAQLGKTVLVTLKGRTLYTLSAERHGKFICANKTCLSFWTPLVVRAHITPTGASGLATVKRPDGRHQVTYKGGPLYTFTGDHARGDAKGEGFKDVGVWHAAAVSAGSTPPPTTSSSSTTTTTGGYGY
ncbi:MAG: COG4315 family predicted lipoprotein [Gaiellaceae bacterium]